MELKGKNKRMRIDTHTLVVLCIVVASALTIMAVRVEAQGCGGCGSASAQAGHGDHAGQAAAQAPMEPIPSVLINYDKIQASLAGDSLQGVPEAAGAISQFVAGDSMKMLPAELAAQADALAKSSDLAAARDGFKQVSALLIGSLERQNVRTGHYVIYCGMAKAVWLQKDKTVRNPYFGVSMSQCGEIKKAL